LSDKIEQLKSQLRVCFRSAAPAPPLSGGDHDTGSPITEVRGT
jgi:hypothetical protein